MTPLRLRLDKWGRLEIIDPGFAAVPLLRQVDPHFKVHQAPLPGFQQPRLQRTRQLPAGRTWEQLDRDDTDFLWTLHLELMEQWEQLTDPESLPKTEVSLLDLKIELARRLLLACQLCARHCGVNRWQGHLGRCSLDQEAKVVGGFVHIAEEPFINPSFNLQLAGCGLRCRFCQQGDFLDCEKLPAPPLQALTWLQLRLKGARSFSFIGGNPDESLYAVLGFLRTAPSLWKLPVVWNCHAYSSPLTLSLLDGLADVYVPDYKFGAARCAQTLAEAPDYPEVAQAAIAAMLTQGVPVIVRILVLPGHLECCHYPALKFLASQPEQKRLWVSIRGQYCPDYQIGPLDGELARRVQPGEVATVLGMARGLGLQVLSDG